MNNSTYGSDIFHRNCDLNLPHQICISGNVSGLMSVIVWLLVLLPQVYHNFRRRSVEGLSLIWAIMNFTAALNHAFFVFKWGTLPLDDQIMAVYMCVLEFAILIQFWMFTKDKKGKLTVAIFCFTIWTTLISLQVLLTVFHWMEWISVTLWSIQTFPQVFLNFKRRSTLGLATGMVILTTIGKTSDFFSTYLLVMPVQFVVMCYFSSTVAFVETLQVIFYWKKEPVVNLSLQNDAANTTETVHANNEIELAGFIEAIIEANTTDQSSQVNVINANARSTKWWNSLRIVLFSACSILLLVFALGLIIRTKTMLSLIAPIGTSTIILSSYLLYNHFSDRCFMHCNLCKWL